jgi:hypothetical protein
VFYVSLVILNEKNFIEKIGFKCTMEQLNHLVDSLQVACKMIENSIKELNS